MKPSEAVVYMHVTSLVLDRLPLVIPRVITYTATPLGSTFRIEHVFKVIHMAVSNDAIQSIISSDEFRLHLKFIKIKYILKGF